MVEHCQTDGVVYEAKAGGSFAGNDLNSCRVVFCRSLVSSTNQFRFFIPDYFIGSSGYSVTSKYLELSDIELCKNMFRLDLPIIYRLFSQTV